MPVGRKSSRSRDYLIRHIGATSKPPPDELVYLLWNDLSAHLAHAVVTVGRQNLSVTFFSVCFRTCANILSLFFCYFRTFSSTSDDILSHSDDTNRKSETLAYRVTGKSNELVLYAVSVCDRLYVIEESMMMSLTFRNNFQREKRF